MGTEKTAWHPPFTGLIQDFGPRWTRTSGELRLAAELRGDDMIEVLADMVRDPNDRGSVLRGMWPLLVWVGLLEFKSKSRPFRRGDLNRLFGYGHTWLAAHATERGLQVAPSTWRAAGRSDLTLFLVVPKRSPALEAELTDLGLTLSPLSPGYHEVVGALIRTVVIELAVAGAAEDDDLMQWFGGVRAQWSLAARRWIGQPTFGQGAMNATPALEAWEDWLQEYLHTLSPEKIAELLDPAQRLAGLAPEERLAGLAPEARLAGLAPEERVADLSAEERLLLLTDDALRGLSELYLATLSADTQARIHARRGG